MWRTYEVVSRKYRQGVLEGLSEDAHLLKVWSVRNRIGFGEVLDHRQMNPEELVELWRATTKHLPKIFWKSLFLESY